MLLLLHGAIGSKDQLEGIRECLKGSTDVHLMTFSGHGGIAGRGYSIRNFAKEVIEYLDAYDVKKADFFGYSMGGYVAMYVARHYPERVGRIVTLGTKWKWSAEIAKGEVRMLDPEKIAAKVPAFAEELKLRHHPLDWKDVLGDTSAMLVSMGDDPPLKDDDLKAIEQRCLLMIGDGDKMVSIDETERTAALLANAMSVVLPATPHPIDAADTVLIAEKVKNFMFSN